MSWKGAYISSGLGSSAIYLTADTEVIGASLMSNFSESICIKGGKIRCNGEYSFLSQTTRLLLATLNFSVCTIEF